MEAVGIPVKVIIVETWHTLFLALSQVVFIH